jgi:PGF-CTERM protein
MTYPRKPTSSAVLSLLVILASLGGGLVAATGSVAAGHGSPGNYTVYLPDQADHNPDGNADVSVWHLAAMTDGFEDTSSPKGFEVADVLTIGSDAIDFSNCGTSNTAAFGLDRGNDDPGTTTDEGLLRHREDSQFNPNGIVVDFYGEDAFAGEPVSINAEDQVVAAQNDCYKMPSEPGWYQIFGTLNGTGYNGNHFEIQLTSHYFYICDCASEQEAREKLGPPPGEDSGSASTPTPEPEQSTPTPEPEQSTPTPTAEPQQSTPTATAAQGGSTQTATPASGGGDQTATAQSQQNGGQQQQQQQQQQQHQSTTTAAGEASAPVTPTVADGPGFGPGLALVALAGAALVALRRSQ